MAFHIINPISGNIALTVKSGESYQLYPTKTFFIAPLSVGLITHQIHIKCEGIVMITREPGIFARFGLWVDGGIVDDGSINTEVFNITEKRARIHKDEPISRLIAF